MNQPTTQSRPCNKRLCIILILATFLLLGFCIGSYFYLKTTADSVVEHLSPLENAVTAAQWQQAQIHYETVRSRWNRHKNFWQCFIRHQEIDDIEAIFFKLKGQLETGNISDSLSSIYELDYHIRHVPDTERLSLYNIL